MEEQTYYISEAAKLTGVEPHVLRYWEEELQLHIARDRQGRRCYSEADVENFKEIKRWREIGMQLKAVKEMRQKPGSEVRLNISDEIPENDLQTDNSKGKESAQDKNPKDSEAEPGEVYELAGIAETTDALQRFAQLLDIMLSRALERNNERLVREISSELLEALDERIQNVLEEEFRNELQRSGEREAAATRQEEGKGLWKRWKQWLDRYI